MKLDILLPFIGILVTYIRDRGCTCTTAEYTFFSDSHVRVLNTCRKPDINGVIYQREAKYQFDS